MVNLVNNALIDIRNTVNKKTIPEYENPDKVIHITFNKQQKDRELKILTPKQMLQRLPVGLAQVEADNTSENLLNEIREINEQTKLLKTYTIM